jgi:hypothetical protein
MGDTGIRTEMQPNLFAFLALLSWPLVTLWLYRARPINQAILWTILGAWLLLPVGAEIKIPGVPGFDKISIPNIGALIGCVAVTRHPIRFWNRLGLAEVLLLMSLIGPFITSELNGDPILIGVSILLPALGHYDAVSAIVAEFIFLIPFFLGRELLRGSADNVEILRAMTIAGLLYTIPILFEIRMSPQLHTWFYGYFPHDFAQQVRNGGYRAVVFLGHGLIVAFFVMMTTIAASALSRTRTRVLRLPPAGITAYLAAILVLQKSMGALIYCSVAVPLVRFTQPRFQLRIAAVLVSVALLYPMLRLADLFPTRVLYDASSLVSGDRAESLEYRFDNEERLLQHASQRLIFGWGSWGRNRLYDEYGKDTSVTDGQWIIMISAFGLFGFVAKFGLLSLPVFRALAALKFARSIPDKVNLAALALILSINIVDLLPNSSISPWSWLLAGALLGRAEALYAFAHQHRLDLVFRRVNREVAKPELERARSMARSNVPR